MGNIKLTMNIMLPLLFALCLLGLSMNVLADEDVTDHLATSERYQVKLTRDPDYKCIQCHKDSKQTLAGTHGQNIIDTLGKPAYCTDCHSNIGPDHRDGGSTVIKYADAQSQAGTDKNQLPQKQILQANHACMDCHTPESLRQGSWTHDVHAKNLTCSNCHDVHAKEAKVLSFDRKELVKMCVDCHADFNHKRQQ